MTRGIRKTMLDLSDMVRLQRRFAQEEDGAVTIFACFMIFILMMVCGIGVDMMRHEMERTRIQAVADRAVLAAADLDQTRDAEEVVRDYFDKAGLNGFVSNVDPDIGQGYKIVTVESGTTFNTQFMDYLGVETLDVNAVSTAEERVPNVEISLLLDISGSMRNSQRMPYLRPAAVDFVNTVLADDVKARTSVTLVPYAGQTNVGPFMFSRLNGVRYNTQTLDEDDGGIAPAGSHGGSPAGADPDDTVFPNVSSCLDLDPADFTSAGLPSAASYDQTPHFVNWNIGTNADPVHGGPMMDWGWCPHDGTEIQYFQNDRVALANFINNMQMFDGTGTHYGLKYAVSMLDPSSSDDVTALIGAGLAEADFEGRPASFSDTSTQKYIILMTDGAITQQYRPKDTMDEENPTKHLTSRTSDRKQITSAGTNINSFFDQCDVAKGHTPRPIIIYTIAFEANNSAKNQMRDCASSESHYFSATDNSIAGVFKAIAHRINQLRLTQ